MLASFSPAYFVVPIDMETVTLSPKFQVVIPKTIREELELRPSQKLSVVRDGGRIQLVPLETPRKLRGFLAGLDTSVPCRADRT
jgi:AbrB family looped-hinge helix DNA binding protein